AIVPDESYAGALAATTLLDAGHTARIWLVGETGRGPYAGRERRKAVVGTLTAAGLALANQVQCSWWPPEAHAEFGEALVGHGGRPPPHRGHRDERPDRDGGLPGGRRPAVAHPARPVCGLVRQLGAVVVALARAH